MSPQVRQQVRPETIRYVMQTKPGLSAEEAELYLLAVIDDVCLACLLAALSNRSVPPRKGAPSNNDLYLYRRSITVHSISYQNPWELLIEVIGAAGIVATAIQTMYNLRSTRRKTEAETEKIRAETRKLKAETRTLSAGKQSQGWNGGLTSDELLELREAERARAIRLVSKERVERPTRELLAEAALKGEYELSEISGGLTILRAELIDEMAITMTRLQGAAGGRNQREEWAETTRLIADNTRLIGSLQRLESVERTVQAIEGNDTV